jgi:hypothetical protein
MPGRPLWNTGGIGLSIVLLLLCSALESCKDGGFSVDVDSTELPVYVDIHVDQSIRIADIGIVLKFEGVSQDERSITLTGVAIGNAYVNVFVLNGDGTNGSYVLNTPAGNCDIEAGAYKFHLHTLSPVPANGRVIDQKEYVATFKVDNRPVAF